ncbi:phospholipid phosphatase [Chlorella sorokiniana]|uniref:Phospholipid phosphatase n=1 Tax=Chlorella sorokiniana TaxID=3076 RepID=A0A2P6U109_CHLSO|nr:phospholipid phosphatase [Chlorella sorokiniana]|eukprot:PRW59992.1 phospholipid phosphatase [Chlorella sorokiniana]
MLGLLPLGGVLAVGCQRFMADKHHVEDIAAGLAIGLSTAALFYLQARASLQLRPPDDQGRHATHAAPAAAPTDLEG